VFGIKPRTDKAKTADRYSLTEYLALVSSQYSFNGNTYSLPYQTTLPGQKAEAIANSFEGYIHGGLEANGVIFGLASTRMRVFSEARFQFQRLRSSRPGDLFGTSALQILERPWVGGTTGDLLAAALLHADFAGNAYIARIGPELVMLRPDWVDILLGERFVNGEVVGMRKVGYAYWHNGRHHSEYPTTFAADEVAHFCPQPDPLAWYRGMSWLTPVIREIQADSAATAHKLKFFENAATPNLAVSLPKELTAAQFNDFVDAMDSKHKGVDNAYKTLYTGGGADVTVIGADLRQLDFKATQGAGETRLAQAAGVPPVIAGLSEGLQGSSLNAGNFGAARRQFADMTLAPLWRNIAGSLETLVPAPPDARLWYDDRDIPFLREDQKDEAEIQSTQAQTIKALTEAGFDPDSILAAVANNDWSMLVGKHSGLFSVQLQEPGAGTKPTDAPPDAGTPPETP
jgi:phage portal protein BeeE